MDAQTGYTQEIFGSGNQYDTGMGSTAKTGASGDDAGARETSKVNQTLERMLRVMEQASRGTPSQTSGTKTDDALRERTGLPPMPVWNAGARRFQGAGGGFLSESQAFENIRRNEQFLEDLEHPGAIAGGYAKGERKAQQQSMSRAGASLVAAFQADAEQNPLDETTGPARSWAEHSKRTRNRERWDYLEEPREHSTYEALEQRQRDRHEEAIDAELLASRERAGLTGSGGSRGGRGGGGGGDDGGFVDSDVPHSRFGGMIAGATGAALHLSPHGGTGARALRAVIGPLTAAFGPVGGPVVGAAAALGVAATAYEVAPYAQSFFATRAQFREEYVNANVLAARAEFQRGNGMPWGTMGFGFGSYSAGLAITDQDYVNKYAKEHPSNPADPQGNLLQQSYAARERRVEAAKEVARIAGMNATAGALNAPLGGAMRWWNKDALKAAQDKLAQATKTAEEIDEQLRNQKPGEGESPSSVYRQGPDNPDDPERSSQDTWGLDPTKFEPDDLRMGGMMAPYLSTLRHMGRDTTKMPPSPDWADQFHRSKTQAEKEHSGVDAREMRQYNTPVQKAHKQEWDGLLNWMGGEDEPPGREEGPVSDYTPVYHLVNSPYSSFSA